MLVIKLAMIEGINDDCKGVNNDCKSINND